MRISVIGCGYLGAVHAAAMAQLGHDVIGVDVDERKVEALSHAQAPFFEPGLPELLAGRAAQRPAAVHHRHRRDRRRPGALHLRRHPAEARRVRGGPGLRRRRLRGCAAVPGRRRRRRRQVHGPGRHRRAPRRAPRGSRLDRDPGVEPRVPARGLRRPGHPAPRPPRLRRPGRRGGRARQGRARRGLRDAAVRGHPAHRHRLRDRAARQGRRELVPRDQDLVHQRDGRAVRGDRRRRHQPRRRDRARRAHRSPVPQRRASASAAAACPRTSGRSWRAPASSASTRRCPSCARSTRSTCAAGCAMVDLAREVCDGSIVGRRVAVLGASFKPDSDDVRDSPALSVAAQMQLQGARVVVTDPQAIDNARAKWPDLAFADDRRGGRERRRRRAARDRVGRVPRPRPGEARRRSCARATSSTGATCSTRPSGAPPAGRTGRSGVLDGGGARTTGAACRARGRPGGPGPGAHRGVRTADRRRRRGRAHTHGAGVARRSRRLRARPGRGDERRPGRLRPGRPAGVGVCPGSATRTCGRPRGVAGARARADGRGAGRRARCDVRRREPQPGERACVAGGARLAGLGRAPGEPAERGR